MPATANATAAASTHWKPSVKSPADAMSTDASSGPTRKPTRRNVSVLAKPAASSSLGTLCLTTANVAPRPKDFHACVRNRPTKIHAHGGTASGPTRRTSSRGASSQNRNPSAETRPNAVSARREPRRSETAPPGYG